MWVESTYSNAERSEEFSVGADDLARHGRLGNINKSFAAELFDWNGQFLLNVRGRILHGDSESGNNIGGVNLLLD
jgi:hypothetical protein